MLIEDVLVRYISIQPLKKNLDTKVFKFYENCKLTPYVQLVYLPYSIGVIVLYRIINRYFFLLKSSICMFLVFL